MTMTDRRTEKDSVEDRKMRGTIVDLIQTTAGGASATIGRHIVQDTNAASGKTVAITMADGAGTVMETEIKMTAIAESMAAAVTADTERMRRSSMATRMESMMARVTVAAGTAIVRRRTAITNMPTMATTQAMATEIITNKPTGRRMNADTRKATSVVAAGAGTNLTAMKSHAAVRMAFTFYDARKGIRRPPLDFTPTSISRVTASAPSLHRAPFCWRRPYRASVSLRDRYWQPQHHLPGLHRRA
jgi:hypothetical protein